LVPTLTTVACTASPELVIAVARLSSDVPVGVIVWPVPLMVRVKLVAELILAVVGSVTTGDPALLIVVVSVPRLVTETRYVPGSVLEAADAAIEVGSDESACTLVEAEPMFWIAVCKEPNVLDRPFRADSCAVSVWT